MGPIVAAASMNEIPIVFESNAIPLVGMLHQAQGNPELGVLVMVAGGPQYRIGGHRQLLLWARKFAAQGFPVFRFDFRGMGDSYGEYVGYENAEDDIRAAIDRLYEECPSLKGVVRYPRFNAFCRKNDRQGAWKLGEGIIATCHGSAAATRANAGRPDTFSRQNHDGHEWPGSGAQGVR
jgi:hypothetical protein